MAGKYASIRLMEMGKNKLRDGSGAEGNDHLIVPVRVQAAILGVPPIVSSSAPADSRRQWAQPAAPDAGLVDGQTSRWLVPTVGNYSNINCRMEIGTYSKEPLCVCYNCSPKQEDIEGVLVTYTTQAFTGVGKLPSPKDQNSPCLECCSLGQW
jgi:hypothetical protein